MSEELKPCPFCGKTPKIKGQNMPTGNPENPGERERHQFVYCGGSCQTSMWPNEQPISSADLAAKWNSREGS